MSRTIRSISFRSTFFFRYRYPLYYQIVLNLPLNQSGPIYISIDKDVPPKSAITNWNQDILSLDDNANQAILDLLVPPHKII